MDTNDQRPLDDLRDIEPRKSKPKPRSLEKNRLWQSMLFFVFIGFLMFIQPDPSPSIDLDSIQDILDEQNKQLRDNLLKDIEWQAPKVSLTDSVLSRIKQQDSAINQQANQTDSVVQFIRTLKSQND